MGALKIMGLFAIVPSIILITISFFVMFILAKTEKKFLRIFGMVVVGLLWVTAFVVFSSGIYLVKGFSKPCLCQCPCSAMMGSGCGMMNKPYHKTMMNPHAGMMDPHAGLMMPPGEKPDK